MSSALATSPECTTPRRELQFLWPTAIALAALGAWIDFAALPGINWAIWTTCATAGLFGCVRLAATARRALTSGTRLSGLLACALATGAALTAEPLLQNLTFVAVAALAAYAVQSQTSSVIVGAAGKALLVPLAVGLRVLREAGVRVGQLGVMLRAGEATPVFRGIALALPVLVVLYLLLANADPILAGWRDAFAAVLSDLSFLPRTLFFLMLLTCGVGAYGLVMRGAEPAARVIPPLRWHADSTVSSDQAGNERPLALSQLERLIVLGSVIALFSLFLALQLTYLFGGLAGRTGSGVTFAEAVHRGFGELTIAAACCIAIVVTLDAAAERGRREPWVRAAGLTLVAQALLLLASAYQRVLAYEDAYGYTAQRLYVQVYECVVGAVLMLLACEIWLGIDRARLVRRAAITASMALACLILLNPMAYVVRANLERYTASGRIDSAYLAELARSSPDAVPELARSLSRLGAADSERVRAALAGGAARHAAYLGEHAWFEWNLRREQARAALEETGLIGGQPRQP